MALSLKAFLGLDGSGWDLGLKRAASSLKQFEHESEHSLKHLAKDKIAELFGLAAIEEGVRRAVEYAHKISSIAKQMGISTDEAQSLEYQMDQTAGSIEGAAAAFKKLKLAQAEASRGNREFREAFRSMGINPDEATGMSAADLYKRIGSRIGGINGELPSGQQEALQKLMGRGADQLIPSFKMGMPEIPKELIIPEETIEKLHQYSVGWKNGFRGIVKFFGEASALITESYHAVTKSPFEKGAGDRTMQAREYLRKRYNRMFGLDEEGDEKGLSEMERKLKAAEARKQAREHPSAPSISVADLNSEQQARAAQSMKEVMDAAKVLSTRNRPQIQKDIQDIQEMRLRASQIEGGDNPADQAEAAQLKFQAYQRVRGLLNPYPDRINLNGLQQQGLEAINSPMSNLAGQTRRLVTVMEQLVSELQRHGISVPHFYQDTNYR